MLLFQLCRAPVKIVNWYDLAAYISETIEGWSCRWLICT